MKKQHILFLCLVFFSLSKNYAQDLPKEKVEAKRLADLSAKMEGTYQLQIVNSRKDVIFPVNLLDTVEEKRSENDTVLFWVNDIARFMILPKKVINKPGFKQLSPLVVHINN